MGNVADVAWEDVSFSLYAEGEDGSMNRGDNQIEVEYTFPSALIPAQIHLATIIIALGMRTVISSKTRGPVP